MTSILFLLLSPVLLLISFPLALFAAFTTTLAFTTLLFRVGVVYAELAAAVFQDNFNIFTPSKHVFNTSSMAKEGIRTSYSSRKGSTASGSPNSGSMTPRAPETSGFGIYSGGGAARDFEGVGGWRIPGSDDEDELWTSMNSRLELPSMADKRQRHHQRSKTSEHSGRYSLPSNSPESLRVGMSFADTGHDAFTASPQGYFIGRTNSKSTSALDRANSGKSLLRHKSSSSSSSSTRTAHLMLATK